jgi:hypothetical protein
MHDSVLAGFLESAATDADQARQKSDCLTLEPDPAAGSPPHTYRGLLKGIDHYVRGDDGAFVVTRRPIPFQIHFPHDYLKSLDPNLQFRVVHTARDLVHPNVNGGVVCLGGRFRPGTRLRAVLEQFHGIATSRVAAIDHPFDLQSADFFLAHLDVVRGFRSEPLWRSPLAARIHVETLNPSTPETP